MKKVFPIMMTIALLFSLCACSEAGPQTKTTAASTAAADQTASKSSTVSASSGEESAVPLKDATIQVFIAASLENAFKEVITAYHASRPNITVSYNADSSGTLQTQIEQGFACDIFFSAAVKQMTALEKDGLIVDGTRVDLLRNQLALITYKGSGTAVTNLETIGKASSIALSDGSVPAGKYTRVALQNLGKLDSSLTPSDITTAQISKALGGVEINETSNVSKTLEAVAEGSNEVGTVYYSDAYSRIDKINIIEMIPSKLTGDIIYPVARVKNKEASAAETAAAEDFCTFLQSDQSMQIFKKYMFLSNLS